MERLEPTNLKYPNIASVNYEIQKMNQLFLQILHGRVLYVDMDPPNEQKNKIKQATKNTEVDNEDVHMEWSKEADLQGKTTPNLRREGAISHLSAAGW